MSRERLGVRQKSSILPFGVTLVDNVFPFLGCSLHNYNHRLTQAEYFRLAPGGRLVASKGERVINARNYFSTGTHCFYLDFWFGRKQQSGGSKKRAMAMVSFSPLALYNSSVGIEINEIQTMRFSKDSIYEYLPIKHKEFFLHLVEQLGLLIHQHGIDISCVSMAPDSGWDLAAAVKNIQKRIGQRVLFPGQDRNTSEIDNLVEAEVLRIRAARRKFLQENGYRESATSRIDLRQLYAKPISDIKIDNTLTSQLEGLDWTNAFLKDFKGQVQKWG